MAEFSTAQQSLERLDRRIASLAVSQHRAWLGTYRDHWWSEVVNDVAGVMKTMSHGPIRYTFDGHPFLHAEGMEQVTSWEATRRMYEGVVDLGVRMAGPIDDERVAFDEHGIIVSCILTAIYPGVFLKGHAGPIDPDGFYLLRWPNMTLVRFDSEGLMMGEDIMNGAPLLLRPVPQALQDKLVDGPL